MGLDQPVLLAFNRGVISVLGLARVDLNRTSLSAAEQTNYMPRTLGPMMLRAGFEFITATDDNNLAKYVPFIRSKSTTALCEFTDSSLRVLVSEAAVTRASVSTAITNGAFTSNVSNWTDADDSGATSAFVTGGYLGLTGNGTAAAKRRQQLTVSGGDQNVEHALDIDVERGPVILRVGSTSGADDLIPETTLRTGTHSIAFTPTGANVFVEFSNRLARQVLVDSVAIASSGQMTLASPYAEADLYKLRWEQSIDVIFLYCEGYQPRRIERQGSQRSWSLVLSQPEDGPFRILNTSPTTLTASAITGNITLTASNPLFKSTHVGALFQHVSAGQRVEADISAENNFSSSIRVTGVGTSRQFSIERAGTWTATVTLQRSIGDEGNWEDVSAQSFTSNATSTYSDGLDNQIVFYRIGIKSGDYSSGTAELALDYAIGSITGVVRITAFSTSTSVSAEVLSDLGGTDATDNWSEGEWSDFRGWPSAPVLDGGRLWSFGLDKSWGSVSDAFESHDPDTEGDSAPINRSIGSQGPVATAMWALPLLRLVVGGDMATYTIKANSFDEPITADAFNVKAPATQGAAQVNAVKVDETGIFVQSSGTRVFELQYDGGLADYLPVDLTAVAPEIGEPGIIAVGVQRQPDTRVHAIRSDGTVALLVRDRAEDVRAWLPIKTSGASGKVVDVVVLPGDEEDKVYYEVERTIDGNTVRYLERWALERECRGQTFTFDQTESGTTATVLSDLPYRDGTVVTAFDADGAKIENLTVSGQSVTLSTATDFCTLNPSIMKLGDSFVTYSGAATSTMTGLDHLEGEDVVVFADGIALADSEGEIATFTVSGGSITLTHRGVSFEAEEIMAGLPYRARFKSSKLAYAAQVGTALSQSGKVSRIGLIMVETHAKGVKFGQSFDDLQPLPNIENGVEIDPNFLWPEYDEPTFNFPGSFTTDTRICLESNAPRPATVAAIPFVIEKHSSL